MGSFGKAVCGTALVIALVFCLVVIVGGAQ